MIRKEEEEWKKKKENKKIETVDRLNKEGGILAVVERKSTETPQPKRERERGHDRERRRREMVCGEPKIFDKGGKVSDLALQRPKKMAQVSWISFFS